MTLLTASKFYCSIDGHMTEPEAPDPGCPQPLCGCCHSGSPGSCLLLPETSYGVVTPRTDVRSPVVTYCTIHPRRLRTKPQEYNYYVTKQQNKDTLYVHVPILYPCFHLFVGLLQSPVLTLYSFVLCTLKPSKASPKMRSRKGIVFF